MTAAMPNPFIVTETAAAQFTPATAAQATAPEGDARHAVAAPFTMPSRFVLNESRFYLDMISMPDPDVTMPLFLRKPFRPVDPVIARKPARAFVEALLRMGDR